MRSAGFRHWPDFFDLIVECRERGASLTMLEALHTSEPVVMSHQWDAIRNDPAWEPLHEYLRELRWDSFASVALIIRGRAAGVLNAFFAPARTLAGEHWSSWSRWPSRPRSRVYYGVQAWIGKHEAWLRSIRFDQPGIRVAYSGPGGGDVRHVPPGPAGSTIANVAIARELAGWCWSLATLPETA